MAYPISPFKDDFDTRILIRSQNENTDRSADQQEGNSNLHQLLQWLCSSPKISSYRVNSLTHTVENIYERLRAKMRDITDDVEICPYLPEVVIIRNVNTELLDLSIKQMEVIVDVRCAAAVLRGAHIFAPGVMGMQSGIKVNDRVSIYADLENNCRKGLQKQFSCQKKIYLGNGIAKLTRSELFGENCNPTGIAVEVYSNISGCLTPGEHDLPNGSCLLQNLSSIICTRVLNPQPDETVLDMCAAPGNKTTHIAALMKNTGIIGAIDKTPAKIRQLQEKCTIFKANVAVFQADSTKIYNADIETCSVLNGPPFSRESFDRILLDAPCSALGQRPQLRNNISEKMLKSYVPLQRKLFETAVNLLKINGRLVYSTCTITLAENEGLVAWAMRTFKCLKLQPQEPHLGEAGWAIHGLSDIELKKVQRFGPNSEVDSVGFFIACFIKESPVHS